MSDQRNLIAAIVLSVAILFGFQLLGPMLFPELFPKPVPEQTQTSTVTGTTADGTAATGPGQAPGVPGAPAASGPAGVAGVPNADPEAMRRQAVSSSGARVKIESPRLAGSVSLVGGRIDDLTLKDYKVTTAAGSPSVHLLSPPGSASPYYANFGWAADERDVPLPSEETLWQASGPVLGPDRPLVLTWDNGAGLRFQRKFELDRDYMVTVTQTVANSGAAPVTLYNYGLISRTDTPSTSGFLILHEGPIGVLNGTLQEVSYDDVRDDGKIETKTPNGWIGITDKYWLTALLPGDKEFTGTFRHWTAGNRDKYQVDALHPVGAVAPGASASATMRLFAGAKEVELLDRYGEQFGAPLFDRAVDFGYLWFLTKPFFYVIDFFNNLTGNFGVAILLLTVCVKLIFFPLANKSYKAMSRMKALQPEMMKLRERYGDDRQKMNQELMNLYRTQKVNPASGCLPILIQIPVFFALYKVILVTIEMRHAPFFGWIHDLSAPDPTNIFNFFGLAPWDVTSYLPHFLLIGIWPILMGISMFMQQRLNPAPADPVQAKVFLFMPIFFTFLLGTFPAGLVIYWTWNNTLSIAQQWVIMRRMGVPVSFWQKSGT